MRLLAETRHGSCPTVVYWAAPPVALRAASLAVGRFEVGEISSVAVVVMRLLPVDRRRPGRPDQRPTPRARTPPRAPADLWSPDQPPAREDRKSTRLNSS